MRIGVDIDEVLTPFTEQYLPFFNKRHKLRLKVSDFVSYEFHEIADVPLPECVETCRLFAEQGGILALKPYPEARRALEEIKAKGHELFIVSGRHKFSRKDTKTWLDEHFCGIFSELLFMTFRNFDGDSTTKADLCLRHDITILIDDDPHYAAQCRDAGVELIMPLQHWNKEFKAGRGVHKAKDWNQVADVVATIAKKNKK